MLHKWHHTGSGASLLLESVGPQSNLLDVRYMLPGILSLFSLIIMLSFVDYASPERITELLIKERVKVAIKGKLHKLSPVLTLNKEENNENLSIAEQLLLIMPPRDSWRKFKSNTHNLTTPAWDASSRHTSTPTHFSKPL